MRGHCAKRAFVALVSALSVTALACAPAANQPTTQYVPLNHVTASKTEQEHDAVFYPAGEFDYFPNRENPKRVLIHGEGGGTLEIACLSDDCNEFVLRTQGLKNVADGSLDLTEIAPNIALVRDGITEKTTGYLVVDNKHEYHVTQDLDAAQAIAKGESSSSGWKTAGKIALGALLVTAILAGGVAAGMAEAQRNNESVTCTTFGNTTRCSNY